MQKPKFTLSLLHPRYWPVWLFVGVAATLTFLPYRLQLSIGKGLGLLMMKALKSRKRVVEVNIALCFPELSSDEQAALVRKTFIDTGLSFMETMISWFRNPNYLMPMTHFHGIENLEAAKKNGGVLLVGAHFSMLDLAGRLIGSHIELSVTYKRQGNKVLNYVMEMGRSSTYKECYVSRDLRPVVNALQTGETVWYAPDQDFGPKHSIFVKFFNVPVAMVTATTRIAKSGKATVLPCCYFRREDHSGYDIYIHPPLPIPGENEAADAQAINDYIEEKIRLHPSQYLWVHKRFKTQPGLERGALYKKKSSE